MLYVIGREDEEGPMFIGWDQGVLVFENADWARKYAAEELGDLGDSDVVIALYDPNMGPAVVVNADGTLSALGDN